MKIKILKIIDIWVGEAIKILPNHTSIKLMYHCEMINDYSLNAMQKFLLGRMIFFNKI